MCASTISKEVMNIDRKNIAILLTAVAMAAIIGGIALNAYAANNGEENNKGFPGWVNERMMPGMREWSRGGPGGRGCYGFVEVSEEFEENVVTIVKSDSDVQDLLDDGYNITGVRPIIKSIVEADGNVETKATSAIVMLEKDTTSHASVWVDMEEEKVTEIVILTRTVIEK
jgi:hypothetical protein